MGYAVLAGEVVPYSRIVAWLIVGGRRTLRASFVAGTCGPSLPGPGCLLEVPDGRHNSLNVPRPCPAGTHRCRASRARRVPGRVPRPDPRGLHPRPAPVHRLVPRPLDAPVLRPPRG